MESTKDIAEVQASSNSSRLIVDIKRSTKPSEPQDLVELVNHVQSCESTLKHTSTTRLRHIIDQVNYLKREATKILLESKRDIELHEAASNLVKKPGHLYHFYSKSDGSKTLSLISPKEWGSSCPHVYLGSYKLNIDMTWTPENEIAKRLEEDDLARILLNTPTSNILGFEFRSLQSLTDAENLESS